MGFKDVSNKVDFVALERDMLAFWRESGAFEELRRLRAVSHAVVWANPHRGRAAYEPVQGGIVAALPHLDHFVAGHSLAAFEELIEVVADA